MVKIKNISYRIRQFNNALFCSIKKEDIEFALNYLDEFESQCFLKLKKSERFHSITVAKMAIKIYGLNDEYKAVDIDRIIKAGLLHDIGKAQAKINLLEKVIMVILVKIFKDNFRKYNNINFINSYYNHGEISYNILENYIKDEKLLYLIKNHHIDGLCDLELKLLKHCDDRS